MEIVLLRSAEDDLLQAYSRHGDKLYSRIDHTLGILKQQPELGSPFRRSGIRRKLVLRTPYGIYYSHEGQRLIIHAILNQTDDPDRIRARMRNL